jgi:tetratricopeptide (TPR) repeat protein
VPQHNFVRWRFGPNEFLNWDTNYGFNRWTDDEYAAQYGVTGELREAGTYLSDLSTENTLGYFCFVRGITFQRSDQFQSALAEYREGIVRYPQSPSSRNNAAWLFASKRHAQDFINKDDARRFAEEACSIHRSDQNLDTLACVCAEAGDFQTAIAIEEEAYKLSPLPNYKEMIEAFRNKKTYLDLHPG